MCTTQEGGRGASALVVEGGRRHERAGEMNWMLFFFPNSMKKGGRWDLKASIPKAWARWFITALCQKSFPQHEMNNDTVIAGTGELLIERYQLYVGLPRGGQRREGVGWRWRGRGAGREWLAGENQKILTLRRGCLESSNRESCTAAASRYDLAAD